MEMRKKAPEEGGVKKNHVVRKKGQQLKEQFPVKELAVPDARKVI